MPREKRDYKVIKALAKDSWRSGERDLQRLATAFDVGIRTIEKWRRDDKWQEAEVSVVELKAKAEKLILEAEIAALEDYIENPKDKEKQSLANMIKNHKEQFAPTKDLNSYIIKFISQVMEFAIENGLDTLRKELQENGRELAEFLRKSNNG